MIKNIRKSVFLPVSEESEDDNVNLVLCFKIPGFLFPFFMMGVRMILCGDETFGWDEEVDGLEIKIALSLKISWSLSRSSLSLFLSISKRDTIIIFHHTITTKTIYKDLRLILKCEIEIASSSLSHFRTENRGLIGFTINLPFQVKRCFLVSDLSVSQPIRLGQSDRLGLPVGLGQPVRLGQPVSLGQPVTLNKSEET